MYEIYKSRAFLLRVEIHKENDQRALFFSADFGLIWVSAQGSKKEFSKFRSLLQELNQIEIYLVKGKGGYRFTGGEFIDNLFFNLKNKKDNLLTEKIFIIKNIFNLLPKFFIYNEPDFKIFDLLEKFIEQVKNIENKEILNEKEVLFLSKIFFLLGYFQKNDLLERVDEEMIWGLKFKKKEIKKLRQKINENLAKIAF